MAIIGKEIIGKCKAQCVSGSVRYHKKVVVLCTQHFCQPLFEPMDCIDLKFVEEQCLRTGLCHISIEISNIRLITEWSKQ